MTTVCPHCSESKSNMPNHWRLSSCDPVEYHPHQIELIEGLLLSDGTVTSHPPNSKFQIGSTNETFLNWLSGLFGVFSGDVRLAEDAESIAERNRKTGFSPNACAESYNSYYRLRTMAHSELNSIRDRWYHNGEKLIPDDFEMTARKLKMWYVGDGSLRHKGKNRSCRASISNTEFDDSKCVDLLAGMEIDAYSSKSNDHILISAEGTKMFFDKIGSPVPGFDYKWP